MGLYMMNNITIVYLQSIENVKLIKEIENMEKSLII